jgi:sugar lactone lactonase YvrE
VKRARPAGRANLDVIRQSPDNAFMKIALKLLLVLALCAAYLTLWPTPVEPVTWTPPPAPALEGVYAYNEKLKSLQRLGEGIGHGPEAIAVDAVGRVYTGYSDGRVVQFSGNASQYSVLTNTGGRPLGLSFGPTGGLVIADARKGLLQLGQQLSTLATEVEGLPFGFTDDVDNTVRSKAVYFSDASHKFGYGQHMADIIEHGANGRLIEHDLQSGDTRLLLKGLHFANGVAVGPDDAYVLVNETSEYRVLRYWLKGDKVGTHEVFIDNLPGFPDNITFNGKDRFWLALAAPRDALLDKLAGDVFTRKLIARLPSVLQPAPKRHGMALALDLDGKVIANLQYRGSDAFSPITSVREHGPWLYFGSLSETAFGRLPLNQAIADAPPPPPGWDRVVPAKEIPLPTGR